MNTVLIAITCFLNRIRKKKGSKGAGQWKDGLSCVILQHSHAAERHGLQTSYQKPKQLSIIQQVQSAPATEEKTWKEMRFERRGGVEEILYILQEGYAQKIGIFIQPLPLENHCGGTVCLFVSATINKHRTLHLCRNLPKLLFSLWIQHKNLKQKYNDNIESTRISG